MRTFDEENGAPDGSLLSQRLELAEAVKTSAAFWTPVSFVSNGPMMITLAHLVE